jgi:hypothetical protein
MVNTQQVQKVVRSQAPAAQEPITVPAQEPITVPAQVPITAAQSLPFGGHRGAGRPRNPTTVGHRLGITLSDAGFGIVDLAAQRQGISPTAWVRAVVAAAAEDATGQKFTSEGWLSADPRSAGPTKLLAEELGVRTSEIRQQALKMIMADRGALEALVVQMRAAKK